MAIDAVSPLQTVSSLQALLPRRNPNGAEPAARRHGVAREYAELFRELNRLRQAREHEARAGIAEQSYIRRLQGVDARVRAHEQAHVAILAGHAGSAVQYEYMRGPDGRLYAVGGSVAVDTSPVPGDPQATIRKARRIRMAAFGPHRPSSQDLRVAAEAYRMEARAKKELTHQESVRREERSQMERQAGLGRYTDLLA